MEFLLGFIAGLNFWAFALIALIIVLEFAFVHRGHFVGSLLTLAFGGVGLYFLATGLEPAVAYTKANLWSLLGYYMLIGLGWMLAKWVFLVQTWKKAYNKAFTDFCTQNKLGNLKPTDELPADQRQALRKYLGSQYSYNRGYAGSLCYTPQPSKNKERLSVWWLWWPFSMLETALGDGLEWLGRKLYTLTRRLLESINKLLIGGYDKNLKDDDK